MDKVTFYKWYNDLFLLGFGEEPLGNNRAMLDNATSDLVLIVSNRGLPFTSFLYLLSKHPLLSYSYMTPYALVDLRMNNDKDTADSLTDLNRKVILTILGLGEHQNSFVMDTMVQLFLQQQGKGHKLYVYFEGTTSNVTKLYPELFKLFKTYGDIIDLGGVYDKDKTKRRFF